MASMQPLKKLTPPIMEELYSQVSGFPEFYSVLLSTKAEIDELPEEALKAWKIITDSVMERFPRAPEAVVFRSWRNTRRSYASHTVSKKWVEHLMFMKNVRGSLNTTIKREPRCANVVFRLFGSKPFEYFLGLLKECSALRESESTDKFTNLSYRARNQVDEIVLKMQKRFPKCCEKVNENLVLLGWREVKASNRSLDVETPTLACLQVVKRSKPDNRPTAHRSASLSPARDDKRSYRDRSAPGGRGRVVLTIETMTSPNDSTVSSSPPPLELPATLSSPRESITVGDSPPKLIKQTHSTNSKRTPRRKRRSEKECAQEATDYLAKNMKNFPALHSIDPTQFSSADELPAEAKAAWRAMYAEFEKISEVPVSEEMVWKAWQNAELIVVEIVSVVNTKQQTTPEKKVPEAETQRREATTNTSNSTVVSPSISTQARVVKKAVRTDPSRTAKDTAKSAYTIESLLARKSPHPLPPAQPVVTPVVHGEERRSAFVVTPQAFVNYGLHLKFLVGNPDNPHGLH